MSQHQGEMKLLQVQTGDFPVIGNMKGFRIVDHHPFKVHRFRYPSGFPFKVIFPLFFLIQRRNDQVFPVLHDTVCGGQELFPRGSLKGMNDIFHGL